VPANSGMQRCYEDTFFQVFRCLNKTAKNVLEFNAHLLFYQPSFTLFAALPVSLIWQLLVSGWIVVLFCFSA
jgi:hypothetical protein